MRRKRVDMSVVCLSTGIWTVRHYAAALLVVLLTSGGMARAGGQSDCNGNDPSRIVAGCSQVIDEAELSELELAIAHSRRSDAHFALREFDDAIQDRRLAAELNPDNEDYERRLYEAIIARGDAKLVAGEFDAAVEDYSTAIDEGLVSADLLAKRSEAFIALGDISGAIDDLKNALTLSEEGQELLERIVLLYELEAVTHMNGEEFDNAVAAYAAAGEHSDLLADPEGKIDQSERNLLDSRFDTNRITGYAASDLFNVFLGTCGSEGNGIIETESDVCSVYRRLGLGGAKVLLSRAVHRFESKEYEGAEEDFSFALVLITGAKDLNIWSPDWSQIDGVGGYKILEVLLYAALSAEQIGELDMARSRYDTMMELDPTNSDAEEGLKRVNEREINIVRMLQIELSRVGCDPGPIDGDWGPKSKAGLQLFAQHSGRNIGSAEPSQSAVQMVSRYALRVCPDTGPYASWDCGFYGIRHITENSVAFGSSAPEKYKSIQRDGENNYLFTFPDGYEMWMLEVGETSAHWYSVASGDGAECVRR